MKSGQLNQRITLLQQSSTTVNAAGERIPVITETSPLWAAVEFKETKSEEKHLANQTTSMVSVNFTIRINPELNISTKDEVVYRGRKHAILSVLEADAKRCYWLLETEQLGENYTN
jgi:SPP1 family predicted phage head-tail adaptor